MIRSIQVTNFKSIPDLTLELGRLNLLIGANGSGKSNILEAIALASAASQNKLDNEFLGSRGIRVTEAKFMKSAFEEGGGSTNLAVFGENGIDYQYELEPNDSGSFAKRLKLTPKQIELKNQLLNKLMHARKNLTSDEFNIVIEMLMQHHPESKNLRRFLIYSPENSALRTFQSEGQILPLGIRGEGLFAHLKGLNAKFKDRLTVIQERLSLIDWFEGFDIPEDLYPGERTIRIRDRFLADGAKFDQRSANEGFLFLLFYVTLLASPETPEFFAIDNVDTSLNPKLCVALVRQVAELAKEFNKQVILTTHNPAVLDGLDLTDDEQRLLVVERNKSGHTRVRRVEAPKPIAGQPPVSMSEAFLRGYIGGLPKNF